MLKIGKKGIAVLFLLVTVLISADLLIGQFFVDHFLKRQYGAPNIVLLLIGLTAVALLTGMAAGKPTKPKKSGWKHGWGAPLAPLLSGRPAL